MIKTYTSKRALTNGLLATKYPQAELTPMRKILRRMLRFYGMHTPWHRGKGVLIGVLGPRLVTHGEEELITLPCGVKMFLELNEFVSQSIYYWGYYEPYLVSFIERHLSEGMIFLDVGAHVGQYTLIAARLVAASGEVHAFEPCSRNFARLKKNVTLNGFQNCYLNKVAAGDFTGYSLLSFC